MTTLATMIPHSRPSLDEADIRAATDVLRSGRVAQGPVVEEFERCMAAFMRLSGGVAVSSGTAALEVSLRVLGVGPGSEVILPSYVCAAPWIAVQRVGATACLVDVDPETYTIDPAAAKRALTAKTRAIIVPHLFGLPAALTDLERLGVPLIEDCAQTLGAEEAGRGVGSVGLLTVCSFYATKLLCTGEGGMVLSCDARLLERARALRQYDESPTMESGAANFKLTDLQAAIGLSQLERLPLLLTRRLALARAYRRAAEAGGLAPPLVPAGRTHVYYRFVVRVSEPNGFAARLQQAGIQCRRPVFRSLHRYAGLDGFPGAEEAERNAISVPLYPSLTDDERTQILTALRGEVS
jgi:dTDP-4-amino-4,6-dideoxygalactose transaminase